MDRNRRIGTTLVIVALLVAGIAAADSTAGIAGRWEGAIEIPGAKLEGQIDLQSSDDGWTGMISIPAQNARDLPLTDITVDGTTVGFSIEGVPGDPTFKGALEGDVLAGEFTQGGQTFPFRLSRAENRVAAATEALAGVDAEIEQALADFGVPGLGLGVVVDGEVVLARGFGKRDLEADLQVTADTLFAIGSSSKAFTTFVLGTLVDEGVVDWDEPVRTYLPDFRMVDEHTTANLTVRDLVCHRSGLPRHDLSWYNSDASRSELVYRLRYLEPFTDLREEFHYQNLMYLTAGFLIEEVTGMSWEDNVRQRVARLLPAPRPRRKRNGQDSVQRHYDNRSGRIDQLVDQRHDQVASGPARRRHGRRSGADPARHADRDAHASDGHVRLSEAR
jgi:CubicO group peptidase (beta-lactamase class C family)